MGLENHSNSFWASSDSGDSLWLRIWASSTFDMHWKQIEKIQKRLITNKFKIKSAVPYAILLSETGTIPIEAIAMVRVISI